MDDPQRDIDSVIRRLTQSNPYIQRRTIETYFTTDASFTHPFCRTGSFDGSRFLIRSIYRWYKIMSPRIELSINSVAYDPSNLILYVGISQIFSIWIIPFHKSHVHLTTVLHLRQDKFDRKYYIKSQDDLYQTDEFVRFFWAGGFLFVWLWQIIATFFCLLGTVVLAPITWFEQSGVNGVNGRSATGSDIAQVQSGFVEQPKGSGRMVTAPAFAQR